MKTETRELIDADAAFAAATECLNYERNRWLASGKPDTAPDLDLAAKAYARCLLRLRAAFNAAAKMEAAS